MKKYILSLFLLLTVGTFGATTAYQGPIVAGTGLSFSGDTLNASASSGLGYTVLLLSSANTTPATSTTYFFGGCPGVAANVTYGTASIDIPKAGTLKRVFYKIRCGTVDTTEANGVAHSIRLNNTTDVASQTFAYTQAATNVINSSVSQAVAVGDTVVVKVVTPASWTVSPAGFHVYVTLYIE